MSRSASLLRHRDSFAGRHQHKLRPRLHYRCKTRATRSRIYELKESFPGFGNDEGGSLAGKLSATVLSIIFSFLCFSLRSSITRSSGSRTLFRAFITSTSISSEYLRLLHISRAVCGGFERNAARPGLSVRSGTQPEIVKMDAKTREWYKNLGQVETWEKNETARPYK